MLDIKVKYHSVLLPKLRKIDNGDWVDLYCASKTKFKAGEFKLISLGVSVDIPEGYEMHIAPRSSTFKTWGILQANSIGIIDNSYCGDNDILMLPALAMRDTTIEFGDKICHFRLVKQQDKINFIEVDSLGNADRGGIGSTGTR